MRLLGIILLLVLSAALGCRKSDREKDTDTTLVEDALNAHTALFEVFLAVHEANLTTPGIKSFITCCTLTSDTIGSPRSLILDFGTVGCISPTSRLRTGKIIVYQNGYYSTPGSYSTVYFDSFYINGHNYSGSFKITSTGTGYKLSTTNLVVQAPGNAYSYGYNGSLTLVAGAGTSTTIADDDEFTMNGTISISGKNGNSATCYSDVAAPVLVVASCAEPVSGNINITPSNLATRTLDLGTGACDKLGTTTLNGEVVNLTISF